MAKYLFLVRTGPSSPERTDEYNEWYDTVHLVDVLKIKGVKAASRYQVAPQMLGASLAGPPFLALYEVEADDPQDFYDALGKASADGALPMSDCIVAELSGLSMWEEITPRVSS
jgi:hypothetical protein